MSETEELKMYFNKLLKTIETQAAFKLGNKYLLDKQRIDDILCCIDANFPAILKNYRKKYNNLDKNIQSYKSYDSLIANIKIKPPLGNNSYFINYNEVVMLIKGFDSHLSNDIKYLKENYPDLL